MHTAESSVEIVMYGGYECLAEYAFMESCEPDPVWMNPTDWHATLNRLGFERPLQRTHVFMGYVPLNVKQFCGHCRRQPNAIRLDRIEYVAGQMRLINLLVGQCPVCRRIYWGQVTKGVPKAEFTCSNRIVTAKTALVNTPPKRLLEPVQR